MKTATKRVGTENDPKAVVIRVGRYSHFRTEWISLKDFIYPDSQTARFFYNLRKIMEKSAFLHENAPY